VTIVEDGLMAQCNQKSSNYKVWSHAAVVGIFATHVHCNRCNSWKSDNSVLVNREGCFKEQRNK